MAQNLCNFHVNSPLGVILVSKDDSAERVLFMYPFEPEVPVNGKINFF